MIVTTNFEKTYQNFLEEVQQNLDNIGVKRNSKIAVGLSGGVDSSSTLAILKELGYDVFGITMKIWNEKYSELFGNYNSKIHGCFGPEEYEDIKDAQIICHQLKTPFYCIDLTKEYEEIILNYFKEEYLNGKTPNPCVMCNWKMKFEYLLSKAIESNLYFDYFATGHYVKRTIFKGTHTLAKANYLKKDQTYYLSFLNSKHIEKAVFPLGFVENKEFTRQIAMKYNLHVFNKPDSQNFISTRYIEIFKSQKIKDGLIVDKFGNILGKHKGIHLYTVGQRKGIGVSHSKPLYVLSINSENNTIIVGDKEDLYQRKFIAQNVNWIVKQTQNIYAKIRYTHEEAKCKVKEINENNVEVEFEEKQMAITPGQVVAFYHNDILLGGAIIKEVLLNQ